MKDKPNDFRLFDGAIFDSPFGQIITFPFLIVASLGGIATMWQMETIREYVLAKEIYPK